MQRIIKKYTQAMSLFTAGFTLIELMVSISIFALVMVISMGSIVSVLDSNRKSQTLRSSIDNLNFSLEGMTRTIRFGSNYHCGSSGNTTIPQDCGGAGDSTITVKDSDSPPNQVTYSLAGGRITRSVNGGAVQYLTSPDINIGTLAFRVFGSNKSPDVLQPQVIIVVRGAVSGKGGTGSSFTLQSTISQRIFDYNLP